MWEAYVQKRVGNTATWHMKLFNMTFFETDGFVFLNENHKQNCGDLTYHLQLKKLIFLYNTYLLLSLKKLVSNHSDYYSYLIIKR